MSCLKGQKFGKLTHNTPDLELTIPSVDGYEVREIWRRPGRCSLKEETARLGGISWEIKIKVTELGGHSPFNLDDVSELNV